MTLFVLRFILAQRTVLFDSVELGRLEILPLLYSS